MKILKSIVFVSAFAGMIVSAILTVQFYGVPVFAVQGICSSGAKVDSCAIVSASEYSSFKGIPMIGEVPIALPGFVFFGFICFLIVRSFIRKNSIDQSEIFSLALSLSAVALLVNASLYLISKFIIKFVCPLCLITYICMIIILPIVIFLLPFRGEGFKNTAFSVLKYTFTGIKKNITTYASVTVLLAACGFALGMLFL